jgi:hypothetical protein
MQDVAIDHIDSKNDCHKLNSSPQQFKKYLIFTTVLYLGVLKSRNQNVLGSLNLKLHLRIFKILFKVGDNFLLNLDVLVVDGG